MLGGTHLLAGLLIGVIATEGQPLEVTAVAAIAGVIGGLAPDIDHPRSTISRRVGLFGAPLRLVVGHRGALHSLPAAVAVFLLAAAAPLLWRNYATIGAAGYASHLILDMMTIRGIPLLWPSGRRWRLMRLRTGGIVEKFILLGMMLLFVVRLVS